MFLLYFNISVHSRIGDYFWKGTLFLTYNLVSVVVMLRSFVFQSWLKFSPNQNVLLNKLHFHRRVNIGLINVFSLSCCSRRFCTLTLCRCWLDPKSSVIHSFSKWLLSGEFFRNRFANLFWHSRSSHLVYLFLWNQICLLSNSFSLKFNIRVSCSLMDERVSIDWMGNFS